MKKTNLVTIVVLIVLVTLGWVVQLSGSAMAKTEYQSSIARAKKYEEQNLYQKAIAAYEKALTISEDKDIRNALLVAYRKAYDDAVITAKEYAEASDIACDMYPEDVGYWEEILEFYLETNNYSAAYSAYQDCMRAGAVSNDITAIANDIVYSFSSSRRVFSEFHRAPSGYYTVRNDFGWGVVSPEGDNTNQGDYLYISPYNTEQMAIFVSEKGARLIDKERVVEAILPDTITGAGAYGNGLVPVEIQSGVWKYLNCESGEFLAGEYEDASSYINGIAAVKKNGKWQLIDTAGAPACDTVFDDIKLHGNKDYAYKRVMVASVNGEYGIYESNGKVVGDFRCKQADIYAGGYLAFQDDSGKWGYVDLKGNIVIQPQFDEAKSFAKGLAAVRVGDLWGFVNKSGTVVIDPQFTEADYFTSGGVCFVSLTPGQYYLITLRFVEE